MVLDLIAAAALSGDPKLCEQNAPRLTAIAAALERRPTDAALYFWEAATWADCRQLAPALAALDKAREHGDGFLPIEPIGFARIWSEPEFQKRRAAFEQALPQAGLSAPVAFRVQGKELIPEGVAYDARSGAVYLGSIAQRKIVRVRDGKQETFAEGLDAVLGLAADAKARRLYAVTTNGIFAGKAPPRSQVLAFDLDSGALLRTLPAKDAGQLNDVAIAADGTVYATDSRVGLVYRARSDDARLEPWLAAGTLPGANGLAISSDHQGALFVAHSTGVARVSLADTTVAPIVNATRETIAAIDGLYLYRGALIGVQNAVQPGRVVQITLDQSGTKATAVKTLLSHHHRELNEPTTGAVDGDRFLLLANSYVGAIDDNGALKSGIELRDPVILEISLR